MYILERIVNLSSQATEREVVIPIAVEGERENGNVIYGTWFDQRPGDTMRDAVVIGLQLLFEVDDRILQVLANIKPRH